MNSQERDYRNAGDGEYVSEEYAKENPLTTVSEPRPEREESRKEPMTLLDYEKEIEALEREKAEVIKPFYENYRNTLERLMELGGVNHYWQDENGTVYKTADCEGRFVRFERYEVQRTRYEDEKKGSLSMTDARSRGFLVEGK